MNAGDIFFFLTRTLFRANIFSLTSFITVSVQQRHSHTETRPGFIEHRWQGLSRWCHPGEWANKTGISKFLKREKKKKRRGEGHHVTDINVKVKLAALWLFFFSHPPQPSIGGTMVSSGYCVPTKAWSQITCTAQNIEGWLEVFMWCSWRVLISGFGVGHRNLTCCFFSCKARWRL